MPIKQFKVIRPYDMNDDEDRFGQCYECKASHHRWCIGVPCECDCEFGRPEDLAKTDEEKFVDHAVKLLLEEMIKAE